MMYVCMYVCINVCLSVCMYISLDIICKFLLELKKTQDNVIVIYSRINIGISLEIKEMKRRKGKCDAKMRRMRRKAEGRRERMGRERGGREERAECK